MGVLCRWVCQYYFNAPCQPPFSIVLHLQTSCLYAGMAAFQCHYTGYDPHFDFKLEMGCESSWASAFLRLKKLIGALLTFWYLSLILYQSSMKLSVVWSQTVRSNSTLGGNLNLSLSYSKDQREGESFRSLQLRLDNIPRYSRWDCKYWWSHLSWL